MSTIFKPPTKPEELNQPVVFLAGSIEMGVAEPWQAQVEEMLQDLDITILNPRRAEWDSSWDQKMENEAFRGQVEWELNGQDRADVIAMYFDPNTKSPISLLELGLYASSGKLIVCCEDGFWRKGNVDIVCAKYQIPVYDKLNKFMDAVRERLMKT